MLNFLTIVAGRDVDVLQQESESMVKRSTALAELRTDENHKNQKLSMAYEKSVNNKVILPPLLLAIAKRIASAYCHRCCIYFLGHSCR